jgi:hypothetical protein
MVNFIETLFGLAIVAALVALVSLLRRRRDTARKFGLAAIVLAGLGGILEVYLRTRT